MQSPGILDYVGLILVLGLFIIYYLVLAPAIGATIASKYGKNYKLWRISLWFLNIAGTMYLLFALKNLEQKDQRVLALVSFGYICVFAIGGIFEAFSNF